MEALRESLKLDTQPVVTLAHFRNAFNKVQPSVSAKVCGCVQVSRASQTVKPPASPAGPACVCGAEAQVAQITRASERRNRPLATTPRRLAHITLTRLEKQHTSTETIHRVLCPICDGLTVQSRCDPRLTLRRPSLFSHPCLRLCGVCPGPVSVLRHTRLDMPQYILCMSEVQSVRLSRRSCMMSVLSL